MAHSDWIPSREQDLVDLCLKWKAGLEDPANVSSFGWDQTEVNGVLGKIDAFLNARTDFERDNSTANRIAKDETKGEMIDAMRDFANTSIRFNKKMSDAVKLWYGVRQGDHTMTNHEEPKFQPETVVRNTQNRFEHKIYAINPIRNDHSKPADAHGVRYAWQVGGEKPAKGEDLPKSRFSCKTSLVITHSEADKTKPVWYATCYENGKGDCGSWSAVVEGVIG